MKQAMDVSAPKWDADIADIIDVGLHDATDYSNIIYEIPDVNLSTSGIAVTNVPCPLENPYYVSIKHRNSIETITADPVSFAGQNINYDFTTAADQAFGNNLKHIGSIYAIYGGNPNQDAIVDGSDMALIDNSSTAVQIGYYPEDLNGDGIVDASDMAIIDNNSTSVVHVMKPE